MFYVIFFFATISFLSAKENSQGLSHQPGTVPQNFTLQNETSLISQMDNKTIGSNTVKIVKKLGSGEIGDESGSGAIGGKEDASGIVASPPSALPPPNPSASEPLTNIGLNQQKRIGSSSGSNTGAQSDKDVATFSNQQSQPIIQLSVESPKDRIASNIGLPQQNTGHIN